MRYLFAILALSVAAGNVVGDNVLVSGGPFKYAEKDHPASDAPDPGDPNGIIVGTGAIGKSVFTSARAFLVVNPKDPAKDERNFDIIRESHVMAQGLQAVADAGTLTSKGDTLGAGHVSIMIPKEQEITVREITQRMKNLQDDSVRAKGEKLTDEIVAKANADPTRPLAEIKVEVYRENNVKIPEPTQPRKPKKSEDHKSGGGAESSTAGGSGTTNCKRDGSFCTLGNRPKKTMATGKNAASTVTKKTAGNPKSRKAATDAAIVASKKSTTRSETRLASSKVKAITGKKAGARGKGASSTKATTTKLKNPATGKKGSTTKKAVTMAARVAKSTTKRIHRRELTMNRPRMVYEAVQGYKRGLMQESMLEELD